MIFPYAFSKHQLLSTARDRTLRQTDPWPDPAALFVGHQGAQVPRLTKAFRCGTVGTSKAFKAPSLEKDLKILVFRYQGCSHERGS